MDINKLETVLIEFQTQINDLLEMQLDFFIAYNAQAKQLNNDSLSLYEEAHTTRTPEEVKEFLASKRFVFDELNRSTDKQTDNIIKMFDERFAFVQSNLTKIKEVFSSSQ